MNMQLTTTLLFKLSLAMLVFSPGLVIPGERVLSGISVHAAESASGAKKTRRTPAMREKVYSQLAAAQKLADEGKVDEGLALLNRLKSRAEQLNSYEKAMMWNFLAFIHYGNENTQQAIDAFSQVVAQKNIPEALELSTLFSLAQLNMQVENYPQTLSYLERWGKLNPKGLNEKALVLKANAHYVMKSYPQALSAISQAVKLSEMNKKPAKENWLVLKRALHYELKQSEEVASISEQLVRLYSKPKYWIELANMYGEIGKDREQLAVMEAAYQQGYVTKKADIRSLAQLYFFSGAPFKSAELLSSQLDKGVLDNDIATLRFLAQSWTAAKENRKAVPVLKKAAAISQDGNMDARLAEVLLNLEQWNKAISAAEVAKEKGKLDSPGNNEVVMGMAYFNLKKYTKAIERFKVAKKQKNLQKMAEQWLKYVEIEKRKGEQLALLVGR